MIIYNDDDEYYTFYSDYSDGDQIFIQKQFSVAKLARDDEKTRYKTMLNAILPPEQRKGPLLPSTITREEIEKIAKIMVVQRKKIAERTGKGISTPPLTPLSLLKRKLKELQESLEKLQKNLTTLSKQLGKLKNEAIPKLIFQHLPSRLGR